MVTNKTKKGNRKWGLEGARGGWLQVSVWCSERAHWKGSTWKKACRSCSSELCRSLGKSFLNRRGSKCKGSEIGANFVSLWNVKETCLAGAESVGKTSGWWSQNGDGFWGRVVVVSRSDRVLWAVVRTSEFILNMVGGHWRDLRSVTLNHLLWIETMGRGLT